MAGQRQNGKWALQRDQISDQISRHHHSKMNDPNEKDQKSPPPIAIIGASYAGLTLANVLHAHSIPYVIFDGKSLPFTHVMGGSKFNVPSYEHIVKKLELETDNDNDVKKSCAGDDDAGDNDDGWTRKEVIESLLQRAAGTNNLITSQRLVRIENRLELFYLHLHTHSHSAKGQFESTSILSVHGPFQSVVGADGVLSKVRTHALPGTYLIGDARWVNDRWYDLGLRRINKGADIAMMDGLELGQAFIVKYGAGMRDEKDETTTITKAQEMRSKYCAFAISRRRFQRLLFTILVLILALVMFNFQNECYSMNNSILYKVKDVIFKDDCLSHFEENKPLLSFQFHNKLQELLGLEGTTYAILIPNPFFWIQLTVLIFIQSIVAILLAMTIYIGIIKRTRHRSSSSTSNIISHLLCWGVILPFAISFPFSLIRFFDVRNRAVLVSTAATPTFVTFRCLEALYGFSPHSVEDSLWNYCLYYSSVIEFVFDEKSRLPAKATRKDLAQKGKAFAVNFVVVSLLLSFMEFYSYQPFEVDIMKGEESALTTLGGMMPTKYFQPGHVGNNFFSAVLTSSVVATGSGAFGFAICGLAGILTLDVFDSPMFKSTSVSDFWGRRWNRLVHGVLKRGVYKPVRKHSSSRTLAALAAFIMSGVLHEYVLLLLSMPSSATTESSEEPRTNKYQPSYGNQFCFFAWNGMLMALEYIFIKFNWTLISQQKIMLSPPPVVKSMMVILMALPVAHWFTDEYIRSGLFSHYAVGFPIIAPVKLG